MDENTRYQVLRNDEEQYSLWPADIEVPAGWQPVGKEGTEAECSAYVDEVWTDMRPKSLTSAWRTPAPDRPTRIRTPGRPRPRRPARPPPPHTPTAVPAPHRPRPTTATLTPEELAMTPALHTERLDFLPYRPEHEDHFVALLRDEEVCRWMGQDLVPEPQLREVFRAILTDVYPQSRFDVWGLWLADAYVGHAEVKPTGNVDGHELVTALAPAYWGHGLGGEAVRGLLRHAADTLGLTEAYGMVGAENTASLALCRRLGFRHVRDVVADDGSVTKMLVIPVTEGRAGAAGTAPTGDPV